MGNFKRIANIYLLSTALPPTTLALSHAINAAHAFDLVTRATANQCPTGQNPCNKNNLPSNFCCPSDQQCIAFNDNKSAICCPNGDNCNTIKPISCDTSKQNATLTPLSQLHSTDLSGALQKCGSACCPNGFSCQNGNCVMGSSSSGAKPSSTAKPSAAATSKPTSASTTGSSSSTPSSSTSANSDSSTQPSDTASPFQNESHQPAYPPRAVLLGFFPGMIAGALLLFLVILCLGHRRSKRDDASRHHVHSHSPKSDFSSVTANVSDPIYQDPNGGFGGRTDFLRRGNRSPGSSGGAKRFSAISRTSRSVRSLFSGRSDRSPTMQRHPNGTYTQSSSPTAPPMPAMPRTPENNHNRRSLRREPSTESIKIYSPPNMLRTTPDRNTTFTEMMQQAGFKQGESYLGSPGRVDPRSRRVGEV